MNTKGKNGKWLHFFLISLGLHIAAFIFMGAFALHIVPRPQESVNVELVAPLKQTQKLRRNIFEPRRWSNNNSDPPKKSQNVARPLTGQRDIYSYAATEAIPIFEDEAVAAKQPGEASRVIHHGRPAIRETIPSKPVLNNAMAHNPQEGIFEIYDQLSRLSSSRRSASLPDYKPMDSTILRNFLRIISGRIEESKRYPRWAMDSGLEGKVVIRFTILRDGALGEQPQLVKSSGTEILDNAAIAAIKSAAPFPALPDSLDRERLQVEVPMDFRLRES